MSKRSKISGESLSKALLSATLLTAPLLLGGCGGGSDDSPQPIPAASPAPNPSGGVQNPVTPPVAAPTAPASSFETQEFLNTVGLDTIGAAIAYSYGATGKGINIAVIDTDIMGNHAELMGKIHVSSIDLFTNERAEDDFDHTGHGTAVAALIAGNKDDVGIHGVAYNAEILAIRADRAGSCVFDGVAGPCSFRDQDIAKGIDHAITHGAQIINLSIGGGITPDKTLENAIKRAVDAGILVVIAAGNEGKAAYTDAYGYSHAAQGARPNEPAYLAGLASSLGLVVAVGSVDSEGRISDFSNRAGGDSKAFYLLAPGEGVISAGPDDDIVQPGAAENDTDSEGDYYRIDGTSFAAPYVAGSLALLLESFPNLKGADALKILIETADDYINPDADLITGEAAGAGIDTIGGAGIINLAEAFQPQGQRSAKINGKALNVTDLIAPTAGAFGDWAAASEAFEGQVFTDKYDRAFALGTQSLNPAAKAPITDLAAQTDGFNGRTETVDIGETRLTFSSTDRTQMPWEYLPVENDIRLSAKFPLGGGVFELGKGGAMPKLAPSLSLSTAHQSSLSASGNWTRFTTQRGSHDFQTFAAKTDHSNLIGTAISKNLGKRTWRAAIARRSEDGTALGSQIQSRLGAGEDRATQYVFGLEGRQTIAQGWHISAGAEWGTVSLPGLNTTGVLTSQFALGLGKQLGPWGDLRASLVQPTRVERGTLRFTAATGMDPTGALKIDAIAANLTPSGRELNLELGWDFAFNDTWSARVTALALTNPHHVANAQNAGAIQLHVKRKW